MTLDVHWSRPEGIGVLPKNARIAFAGLCARRAEVVFRATAPAATPSHHADLTRASSYVMQVAARNPCYTSSAELTALLANVHIRTVSAVVASSSLRTASFRVRATGTDDVATLLRVRDAYAAANAATDAADAVLFAIEACIARDVAVTVAKAANTAAKAGVPTHDLDQDFSLLLSLCREHSWTDQSPIALPLLPHIDVPAQTAEAHIHIRLDIPRGVTGDQAIAAITKLVSVMDDHHKASGGRGVMIDLVEAVDFVESEVIIATPTPPPSGGLFPPRLCSERDTS